MGLCGDVELEAAKSLFRTRLDPHSEMSFGGGIAAKWDTSWKINNPNIEFAEGTDKGPFIHIWFLEEVSRGIMLRSGVWWCNILHVPSGRIQKSLPHLRTRFKRSASRRKG